MKKTLSISTILLFTALLFNACKKGHHDKINDKVNNISFDTTISAGTTYQLDLSPYSDADDSAKITTQATNFTISEINSTTTPIVYSFLQNTNSKIGESRKEVVVLKIYEPAGHKNCHEKTITINFTIL